MATPSEKAKGCEKKLGIVFNNKEHLITALTHRSYARRFKHHRPPDNERLEFFGDAILKFVVSEYLMARFPTHSEGSLTKIRSRIISDQTLSVLAKRLNFGPYILMSPSEERTGGSSKKSILSNTLEALIGAYYLDQGIDPTRQFIINLIETNEEYLLSDETQRDHKSELQEYLQKAKLPPPSYVTVKETGPDHVKTFHIETRFTYDASPLTFHGRGSSKKEAEQKAAEQALAHLQPALSSPK